jgi:hypothetical protein
MVPALLLRLSQDALGSSESDAAKPARPHGKEEARCQGAQRGSRARIRRRAPGWQATVTTMDR